MAISLYLKIATSIASRLVKKVYLESAVRIGQLVGFGISLALGVNCDGGDLLLLYRAVLHAGSGGSDGIHNFHAGSDFAEGGVLAVQMFGILMHNEELTACRVGGGGASHTQNTPFVAKLILYTVEEKLALDAVAGAAHAGAIGATALDHKAGNDPVEDQAIIVVMIAQVDEVIHALGRGLGIEFTLDDATVFHSDLKSRICHISTSLSLHARSDAWRLSRRRFAFCRKVFCPCTAPHLPLPGCP